MERKLETITISERVSADQSMCDKSEDSSLPKTLTPLRATLHPQIDEEDSVVIHNDQEMQASEALLNIKVERDADQP
jgi:hypothetical protein